MAGLDDGQRLPSATFNCNRGCHRPSNENLASLQPAARQYENWMPVMKFKHGRWKVKWKKDHREDRDELAHEGLWENENEQGHAPDE